MSEELAPWILRLLEILKLSRPETNHGLGLLLLWVGFIVAALVLWRVARWLLDKVLHGLARKTKAQWDEQLLNRPFLSRLSFFIPLSILSGVNDLLLPLHPGLQELVDRMLNLAAIVNLLLVGFALANGIEEVLSGVKRLKDKPIASYVQLAKISASVLAGIATIALLIGQDIGVVVGGLGAATAIILLVFRDALLGLTASVQLSSGDLVRIGDWVQIDKYGADGDVVEINLTTVKVRNWDMTFTVVPTYALISESFKNWRGMSESGGRRMKRSITLRSSSVKFADEALLKRLEGVQVLAPWLAERTREIAQANESSGAETSVLVNGRRLTNIGLFRNYTERYLRHHPGVNQDMTLLVRHLQPTGEGVPVEFYCFAQNKEWAAYESLMADILDHLLAAAPYFELEVFEWRMAHKAGH
jgi:miniconductance mechanosensitive channel